MCVRGRKGACWTGRGAGPWTWGSAAAAAVCAAKLIALPLSLTHVVLHFYGEV